MSARRPGTVLITGAGGFVGRHLCRRFHASGWRVRGTLRDVAAPIAADVPVERFAGELPHGIDPAAFEGADVVIHCAYTTAATNLDQARRVNEEGTARVLELSRQYGAGRFAFISTTSAHDEARSYYGRSKLALERRLDPARDLVLRAGLILGPDGGLFQRITATIRSTGVIPVFDGGRQPIQTVHVDDFCLAVEQAVLRDLTGTYVVAEPDFLPLGELFRMVARKMNRRCVMVPVPTGPLLLALRLCERLGIRLPVSSENLLGARALTAQPSDADLAAIGVELRSAAQSLDDLL